MTKPTWTRGGAPRMKRCMRIWRLGFHVKCAAYQRPLLQTVGHSSADTHSQAAASTRATLPLVGGMRRTSVMAAASCAHTRAFFARISQHSRLTEAFRTPPTRCFSHALEPASVPIRPFRGSGPARSRSLCAASRCGSGRPGGRGRRRRGSASSRRSGTRRAPGYRRHRGYAGRRGGPL